MPAGNLARSDVVTATSDSPVRDLATAMDDENVGSVVISDDNEPVGIVTDRDPTLRALAADEFGRTDRRRRRVLGAVYDRTRRLLPGRRPDARQRCSSAARRRCGRFGPASLRPTTRASCSPTNTSTSPPSSGHSGRRTDPRRRPPAAMGDYLRSFGPGEIAARTRVDADGVT